MRLNIEKLLELEWKLVGTGIHARITDDIWIRINLCSFNNKCELKLFYREMYIYAYKGPTIDSVYSEIRQRIRDDEANAQKYFENEFMTE